MTVVVVMMQVAQWFGRANRWQDEAEFEAPVVVETVVPAADVAVVAAAEAVVAAAFAALVPVAA